MSIVAVGLNYAGAPLEARERLSVGRQDLDEALAILRPRVREGLIVSTCNRTEVYAVPERGHGADVLLEFLAQWGGLSRENVRHVAYARDGEHAVRHVLRVASGLDSMVLGEDQIQAQVKRALAVARHAQALGPTLERLGSAALACGKRVRTFTGIGRHSVSLESLALRAAAERIGPLDDRRVVLIGAGESATLVARQLKKVGTKSITIVSRSIERTRALALSVGAQAGSLADLADALCKADVVFACTSAPHPVLTPDFLAHRAAMRPGAPMLCVDLGMPRDVHPNIVMLPGVSVVTLDELSTVADAHREARRSHIPAAEAIVDAEANRFMEWLKARAAAANVADVDTHGRAVAQSELARTLARLPSLGPRERELIAELAHRIARKLTRQPTGIVRDPTDSEKMALG